VFDKLYERRVRSDTALEKLQLILSGCIGGYSVGNANVFDMASHDD